MIGRTPLLLVLGGPHSGCVDYVEQRLRGVLPGGSILHVDGDDVAGTLEGRRGITVVVDDFASALRAAWPADTERAEAYAIDVAETVRSAAGMLAVIVSSEPTGFPDNVGLRLGAANRALAATAEEVVLVVAGLPVQVKGGEEE